MRAVRIGMERITLRELWGDIRDPLPPGAAALPIGGVRDDSRRVEPGDVFVAVRGAATDGGEHIAEAITRGAACIVAERAVDGDVPIVRVTDARIALAGLAAAWFGHPARGLTMVGITGTVGKTSVLAMLEAILERAAIVTGTIGSLGVRYAGTHTATLNTTPGILDIQRALAGMRDARAQVAAMEVTSHALVQRRVHGLRFDLGIFTNLTMLEHLEYHRSFRAYAGAKLKFLEHLRHDAPLIYAAGDRIVRQAARRHEGPRISCGGGNARVHVRRGVVALEGTRITLDIRRPLSRLDGSFLEPCRIPILLRTLGRPNTANATLAATAGLCLGAMPEHVRSALASVVPPRRRMEVIRHRDPVIIDDTVGHPDSITGIFELVGRVPHGTLHVVFAVRGRRGAQINGRDAEALAIWSRRVSIAALHVTSAIDTADERNVVSDEEREAFLGVLRRERLAHTHHARLEDAIAAALDGAHDGDLVLLLGAQGMDAGAELARRLLQRTGEPAGSRRMTNE
ncbi:MAG TPA: Mur ligase family protein [Longimicrobiales bacterium]